MWTIGYRHYLTKLSLNNFLNLFITWPAVRKYLPPNSPSYPLPRPPPPHLTSVTDVDPPCLHGESRAPAGPTDAREKQERQSTSKEKTYSPSLLPLLLPVVRFLIVVRLF